MRTNLDKTTTTSMFVECEQCKQGFEINLTNKTMVSREKHMTQEGKTIYLSYYICPDCAKVHYVQVDDDVTLKILGELKSYLRIMSKSNLKQTLSKKKKQNAKNANKQLKERRQQLMQQTQGKVITKESGASFIIKYSVEAI